jgi:predicted dehydrogenase
MLAFDSIADALLWRPHGVIVATDTGRHLTDVEPWLTGGAVVLVEKPLARACYESLGFEQEPEL